MNKSKPTVLTLDDDTGVCTQYRWLLSQYRVVTASTRAEAIEAFKVERPPLAIVDLGLPPDPDGASEGLAAVEEILRIQPATKVIVVSGNENREFAVRAIAVGAYDFFRKPVDPEILPLIVQRALHVYELEQENRRLLTIAPHSPIAGIICSSPQMLKITRDIERLAKTDIAVLLLGESGTGKELLANALHRLSPRADKPFIAINCAAIPDALLEAELFGHERGAFTGAIKQTIGKIESSNGGTLFLDEVGDIPLNMQVKLLRFLEDRVVERVGGRQRIVVDTRIVCATNQNLKKCIEEGRFREDLYYRINEVTVTIPPLREREGDTLMLANFFLRTYAAQFNRPIKGLSSDALAAIQGSPWRGNVRELENRMKRAVIMTDAALISAADLDLKAVEAELMLDLNTVRRRAEREAINTALAHTAGNISRAASLLGVSRPTLYDLFAEHGINSQQRSEKKSAPS